MLVANSLVVRLILTLDFFFVGLRLLLEVYFEVNLELRADELLARAVAYLEFTDVFIISN
jgi:hypothetical protein